jgi:hypothetical protein
VRNAELLARINGRHPLIAGYVEEVHRLYNKRARQPEEGNGAGQWLPEGAGQSRADILEELTHGRHMQQEQCTSEESAAAVSNMQQRQSAGFSIAEV